MEQDYWHIAIFDRLDAIKKPHRVMAANMTAARIVVKMAFNTCPFQCCLLFGTAAKGQAQSYTQIVVSFST